MVLVYTGTSHAKALHSAVKRKKNFQIRCLFMTGSSGKQTPLRKNGKRVDVVRKQPSPAVGNWCTLTAAGNRAQIKQRISSRRTAACCQRAPPASAWTLRQLPLHSKPSCRECFLCLPSEMAKLDPTQHETNNTYTYAYPGTARPATFDINRRLGESKRPICA